MSTQNSQVRLAHLETEVQGLRSDFDEVKQLVSRLFDKLDVVSQKGNPSWQAIIAFVFSGVSALSIIGGGIGVVVALFVRVETGSMRVQQVAMERALDRVIEKAEVSMADRAATGARLAILEQNEIARRRTELTVRDAEEIKDTLRAEIRAAHPTK